MCGFTIIRDLYGFNFVVPYSHHSDMYGLNSIASYSYPLDAYQYNSDFYV